MHFEVEQKYPVDDLERVRAQLASLGAVEGEVVEQADCYYNHPVDDFEVTDEALRLRRQGDRNFITYKGPKVDPTTKTRHEVEVALADGEGAVLAADEIFRHLRFQPVALVKKRRQTWRLAANAMEVEVALDQVDRLGAFVELEVSVDSAGSGSDALDAAKRTLVDLASRLGLTMSERRSYLELLLDRQAGEG